MEELATLTRYTIAISTFVLSMLVMFRMGAPYWTMEPEEDQPEPEPRERRKLPSPPPAKEQEAEDEDKFTCQLADDESTAMEWSVNYKP
jgi:outer membrane biosynthesis protein TonB